MLRALLGNEHGVFGVATIVLSYTALILLMLPIHEFAHAFMANRLGDDTAKWEGRLTLNPFAHLDKLGTLMLLLVGIGYAKPVPVNPYNFRDRKKGMALTALAGPLSNFLMATLSIALFAVVTRCFPNSFRVVGDTIYFINNGILYAFVALIQVFASVNLALMVFNLLPIHPLDGSRIFAAILPNKWAWKMQQYQMYITFIMMAVIFMGILDTPLYWVRRAVGGLICRMFGLPNLF